MVDIVWMNGLINSIERAYKLLEQAEGVQIPIMQGEFVRIVAPTWKPLLISIEQLRTLLATVKKGLEEIKAKRIYTSRGVEFGGYTLCYGDGLAEAYNDCAEIAERILREMEGEKDGDQHTVKGAECQIRQADPTGTS